MSDTDTSRRQLLQTLGGLATAVAGSRLHAAAQSPPATADGWPAADRLVAATGGRAAWSRIGGLVIRARHYETSVRDPYDNVIHMALDRPLMRFEGRNATMDRVRVIDGAQGARRSELSPPGPLTPAQVRADRDWWEAHVYRNIWRLARRDPAIAPRLGADGLLELHRAEGGRLMWYRLNQLGEPVAFAPDAAAHPTILGPLAQRAGGLRSPVWTSSGDGTFRVEIREWRGTRGAPTADYRQP